MSQLWTVNKSFWFGLFCIICFLLILICSARADDSGICSYTFNETEAKNIVILYDQLNQCRGLATSEGFLVDEYNNKILLMESAQKNLESALLNCDKANEALKRIVEAQKAEQTLRMEKCLKDIEAAKPTFKDRFTWGGVGWIVGVVCGVLLL